MKSDKRNDEERPKKSQLKWEWKCLECGKIFKSVKAAEAASLNGCPGCGSTDIDVAP